MKRILLVYLVTAAMVAYVSAEEPDTDWEFSTDCLRPFWVGQTMQGETVLFLREQPDGQAVASLLFEPTKILSVRDSTGKIAYQEGRDYSWQPGSKEIRLPPGSRIVFKTPQELRRSPGSQRHRLTHRDGNGEILFGATHEYHDMQTSVSYEHKGGWAGPTPSLAGDTLPRTIQRLSQKQPLTIALLGDSISTGCNASGWAKVAPFQPPYQDLLVLNLEATGGSEVTLHNFAVGGTDTAWGRANIGKVIATKPDLVILAFGMNDSARRPAADYKANIREMVDAVRQVCPEAEFILVATMLGNRDWTYLQHELFPQYRDALAELCGPGVALADLTSFWQEMFEHKADRDLTGNGVNHPNDFGHRVYAQVLSALLIPVAGSSN